MNILHQYLNGNVEVVLYEDGTKERSYQDEPRPLHPESIDVKITNYCDAGCSFCHEQSTTKGVHGDLLILQEVLGVLPAGVEVAIGGGNPLDHPQLISFLEHLQEQGLVANITINQKHLFPFRGMIIDLITRNLVRGVGISYSSSAYLPHIKPILQASSNVVFHLIMGINQVLDVVELNSFCRENNRECKVLILGYKEFGFGINYYLKNKKIEDNKYSWYTQLATHFKDDNLVLSFDNLAIKQLKLDRYFTPEAWNEFYMGDDFVFTMYMDGVNQEFAPTSTSVERTSFSQDTLLNYFQSRRKTK
jgi:organic radical activating enzyme